MGGASETWRSCGRRRAEARIGRRSQDCVTHVRALGTPDLTKDLRSWIRSSGARRNAAVTGPCEPTNHVELVKSMGLADPTRMSVNPPKGVSALVRGGAKRRIT